MYGMGRFMCCFEEVFCMVWKRKKVLKYFVLGVVENILWKKVLFELVFVISR